MIDYATWCAIREGVASHLTAPQLADSLDLDVKTVRHWMDRPYAPRAPVPRTSKLDPYKGRIVGWLDAHPLTAQQVFQRLRDAGYEGGISIVKDYVHKIRPPRREAFLTLAFAPGEAAQVDWGEYGTICVGNTRRRLSFFVMVLAWSRKMYVEFTLSQTMEQFLAAHINAFAALGVSRKVMVDNLRSAVLRHVRGEPVQFNPRYLDFARHYGFEIVACAPRKGNEKGLGFLEQGDIGNQQPNYAFALPVSRMRIVPQAREVFRQRQDGGALLIVEPGLALALFVVVLLGRRLLAQRLVPLRFQRIGNQAVVGIAAHITAACQVGLVARPFNRLTAQAVAFLGATLQFLLHGQRHLQGDRGHRFHQLLRPALI
jgi:transposase